MWGIFLLVIIFSIVYFYFCWKNLANGFLFLIFCLPSYLIRYEVGGIKYNILPLMIWLLFLAYLGQNWQSFKNGIKKSWQKFNRQYLFLRICLLFFLASAIVSFFISPARETALVYLNNFFVEPLIVFFLFLAIFKNKNNFLNIWRVLGSLVIFIAIVGFWQKFSGWKMNPIYLESGQVDRITSIYGFPNAIGLFVGPIVVFYLAFLARKSKDLKELIFKILVIVFGLGAIILAKSEGAIVGILVATFFLGIVKKQWRIFTLIFSIIFLIIIFSFPNAKLFVEQKIFFHDWSGQVRLTMWRESLAMMKDNWFWGVGLAGYPILFADYHQAKYLEIFQYPHNIFLNFWSELGIVGLISFLMLSGYFVFKGINFYLKGKNLEKKIIVLGLVAVIIEIFIHGLVDVPYFKSDLAILFWLVCGSIFLLSKSQDKQVNS